MTSSCQHVVDGPGQIWFSFQTIGAINFVRPQSILETLHYYTKRPLSSGTLQIFFSTIVIRISCIWLDSCKFDFHFKLSTPLFGTPLINCYHKSNCFKLFTSLVYLHWFFFQSSSLKYRVWWTGFFSQFETNWIFFSVQTAVWTNKIMRFCVFCYCKCVPNLAGCQIGFAFNLCLN